jgi:hypothetical protein
LVLSAGFFADESETSNNIPAIANTKRFIASASSDSVDSRATCS